MTIKDIVSPFLTFPPPPRPLQSFHLIPSTTESEGSRNPHLRVGCCTIVTGALLPSPPSCSGLCYQTKPVFVLGRVEMVVFLDLD